jgi:hypothetical protein
MCSEPRRLAILVRGHDIMRYLPEYWLDDLLAICVLGMWTVRRFTESLYSYSKTASDPQSRHFLLYLTR